MSVKLGGPDRFVGADFLDQERTDSYPPKLSENGFPERWLGLFEQPRGVVKWIASR